VFNLSGSEIVVILLLALIVLGPEKLPEAIRKFGRVYSEVRKISNGFQSEFKNAFDEPMRELRETAQMTRDAVMKPLHVEPETKNSETKPEATPETVTPDTATPDTATPDTQSPSPTENVLPTEADGDKS
jgi:sec-independent protein translocase protein TatB